MANNRADGVLMPVINGEIRAATGFKQRELSKINPRIEIVFAGGGFRRRRRFGTVAERRQAEARRDHPQQEMRPEIPSAKLSPARQHSTHLLHHISQPVQANSVIFCAQILPLKPIHISRNEAPPRGKTVKNAANAHIFCARQRNNAGAKKKGKIKTTGSLVGESTRLPVDFLRMVNLTPEPCLVL
jgi:hypothetical protein